MNIHDLIPPTLAPQRSSAYIIVYLIPTDGSQIHGKSKFSGWQGYIMKDITKSLGVDAKMTTTVAIRHYASSLHIIHSDWDSIKFG